MTNSKNEFFFTRPINDDEYSVVSISPGAYKLKNINNEIEQNMIKERHFTEATFAFTIKANFSTLGSFIEISRQGPIISFLPKDSIGYCLAFNAPTLSEKYNLSQNPVDILSFDNIIFGCNIAQNMVFRGKRSGIIHKLTMDVDPGKNIMKYFVVVFNSIRCKAKILFQVFV